MAQHDDIHSELEILELQKTPEELEAERQFRLRRRATRFPANNLASMLVIAAPKMEPQRLNTETIDISARGAFLRSPSFVHPGKNVTTVIRKLEGELASLPSIVKWCDYEVDNGHRIGVEFHELIDPRVFIDPAVVETTLNEEIGPVETVTGNVLIATTPRLRSKIESDLESINVSTRFVSGSQQALEIFLAQPIDVLITDRSVGTAGQGGNLARAWRDRGFTGPVILVGEQDDLKLGVIAEKIGASDLIRMPWSEDRLTNAVTEALMSFDFRTDRSGVFSTVEALFGTPKPVRSFIAEAQKLASRASEAQRDGDAEVIADLLVKLESGAVEAGFPQYADMIASVRENLSEPFAAFDGIRRLNAYATRLACRADGVAA